MAARQFESPIAAKLYNEWKTVVVMNPDTRQTFTIVPKCSAKFPMVRYYELTLANSKRPTHKPMMHPDQLDEWCLELEEVSASTCEICDRR